MIIESRQGMGTGPVSRMPSTQRFARPRTGPPARYRLISIVDKTPTGGFINKCNATASKRFRVGTSPNGGSSRYFHLVEREGEKFNGERGIPREAWGEWIRRGPNPDSPGG